MSIRNALAMAFASTTSMVLLASVLSPAVAAEERRKVYIPDAPLVKAVPHKVKGANPAPAHRPNGVKTPLVNGAHDLPAPAVDVLEMPAKGLAGSSDLPVEVGSPAGSDVERVKVEVHSEKDARRAGVHGVLVSVAAAEGGGDAKVRLDYSDYAQRYGANWASRLRVVQYPACILTTPERPKCQQGEALASTNNVEAETLSAVVELAEAPSAPAQEGQPADERGAGAIAPASFQASTLRAASTATGGAVALAVQAGVSGSTGDFGATSLGPSGSWSSGGSTGSFTWGYDIEVPSPGIGQAPSLSLGYSTSGVDGQNTTSNNQSSWVGTGWGLETGFVERTYRSCADITSLPDSKKTGDQCWAGDIVNLSLPGGASGTLVKDDTSGQWRVEGDEGMKVELKEGAENGLWKGENWVVTSRDGTKFHFGLNRLPGAAADGSDDTHSALGVPVFGPVSGDSCYSATMADAKCAKNVAYRWMLDYVVDVHGNSNVYSYAKEKNQYASIGATAPGASKIEKLEYDRAAYLKSIRYGLNKNDGLFKNAPQRVDFTVAERCNNAAGTTCTDANFDAGHAAYWPDVPVDLHCTATSTCTNYSPSFWSRKRLGAITTKYLSDGTYKPVDTYTLGQSFSTLTGDELILDSISRTGGSGSTAVTMSPVTFTMTPMANRVEGLTSLPAMLRSRLTSLQSETGQTIEVKYNGQAGQSGRAPDPCTPSTLPASRATNKTLCYPVKWGAFGTDNQLRDYFHKYVVTEVVVRDRNANTPPQVTTYNYKGGAAWRYADHELTKPKNRDWSQFRGFGEVETRVGDPSNLVNGVADKRTLTKTFYFRGMDGNLNADEARVGATVTPSAGGAVTDLNVFSGQPYETQEFDFESGELLKKSVMRPTVVEETATRARPGLSPQKATIVRTAWTESFAAKATGGFAVSKETDTFDEQGRSTRTLSTASDAATLCVERSYADNATTWVRDLVAESKAYSDSCGSSKVLSHSRSYYDGQPAGQVSLGNETKTEAVVDASARAVVERGTFDVYGRQVRHEVDNPGAAARITSTAFTPAGVGVLQKVETTAAISSHKTIQTLDPARGQTTKLEKPGGLVTEASFDGLGRRTAVWHPGQTKGTDPASVMYEYTVSPAKALAVRTKTYVDPGNGATPGYVSKVELYDALGKLRQTQQDAPGGGRLVSDAFADSHGWVRTTYDGWHATGEAETSLITTTASGAGRITNHQVDGLGRETQRTETDSGQSLTTKTVYGGDRVTVLPPAGDTASTEVYDARGNVLKAMRYKTAPVQRGNIIEGGTSSDQNFTYDALGQQLTTTVPKGADTATQGKWSYTYDLLGRVTRTETPSAGVSTTEYFDAGEVRTATDGANRSVSMTYDALGRPLTRKSGTTTLASWVYDTKKVGYPSSATSYEDGGAYTSEVTGYDAVGRPLGTKVSLPSTATGFEASYTSSQTWSATGLMTSSTVANTVSTVAGGSGGVAAEKITHRYDKFGNPLSMAGTNVYVQDTAYNAFFEASRSVYGVNASTMTSIVDRGAFRRVTATTLSGQLAAPQIDKTSYVYDTAGNITSTVNQQGNATTGPIVRQCFKFDALRQLTEAWSTKNSGCTAPASTPTTKPTQAALTATANSAQPYWMRWTYGEDGSRETQDRWVAGSTAVESTTYAHTNAGAPHRLMTADSTVNTNDVALTYFNDGSVATRKVGTTTQTFAYDPDGSLKTISSGSGTTERKSTYVHDAGGGILLRKDTGSSTLYLPGQQVTVSSAKAVTVNKFYEFDGNTVATRLNRGAVKYTLADANGSTQVTVDPANSWTVVRRYLDPYGSTLKPATGSAGVIPGDRSFLDQPLNSMTGLVDMGARQYDSLTGQFLSVDPVLDGSSVAQAQGYTYANNNPIAFSDSSGLWWGSDAIKSVAKTVTKVVSKAADVVKQAYTYVKPYVAKVAAPVVDRVQSAARSYSTAATQAWNSTRSAAATTWNAASSGATKVAAASKALVKKVDVVGAALKTVAVEAYNFAVGDMIRACSQGLTLSCGAELAMMTPWGKVAKVGKLALKVVRKVDDVADMCRVNSFTSSTPVLMADGSRKPIKDVALGDKVMAADPKTGEKGGREVVDLIRHGGLHTMVEVRLSDGSEIDATDGHPFWVESRSEWVAAEDLWPGDVVLTASNERLRVKALTFSDEDLTAYNLTVDGLHTYYAGDEPVLVHNCGKGLHLNLHYKDGWDSGQLAAADGKVAALNGFDDLAAASPVRRSGSRSAFLRDGGVLPKGSDLDHVRDLQLGGADVLSNMSPLDASVNRSLGAQIAAQLRGVTPGTRICGVSICARR